MLGEQIRKIRKQKKITLEALAGQELTKGMLSLIENNKANPSMESLTYIADRLGVEVSELLEEVSSEELREILEKAEKLFNTGDFPKQSKQLLLLIEPIIEKLPHGYETARLLDIYSRGLYFENKGDWQDFAKLASKMYDEMNLTAKRTSIGIFKSSRKFIKHDYVQALEIFLQERADIEARHVYIDPMTRLDLDYQEAVLHFAVGNSDEATRVMESAIDFSKEHRTFYRIDDLYRLAAAQAMMTNNHEKKDYYLRKLKQYGEFAEDLLSNLFYNLLHILSLTDNQEYLVALDMVEQYLAAPKMKDIFEQWFLLEKGRILFCLHRYQEALPYIDQVKVPAYAHHPFDLALFYMADSYKALCQLELGNPEAAYQAAKTAVENFKPMPPSSFKDFAIETLEKIHRG
jgi:transcriptional regulator with XRE-family HTH domain